MRRTVSYQSVSLILVFFLLLTVVAAVLSPSHSAASPSGMAAAARTSDTITRVTASALGMVEPRGATNIYTRVSKLKGVWRFRVDLATNAVMVDFKPGAQPTEEEIEDMIRRAGWTPGGIKIERIPLSEAHDTGDSWLEFPRLDESSGFVRWLQMNFTPWTVR